MIADFFTKPLQGKLFAKFRDVIMGITHFSTLVTPESVEPRSVLEMVDSPSGGSRLQAKKGVSHKKGVVSLPVTNQEKAQTKISHKLN
jgi:hypothetical protein